MTIEETEGREDEQAEREPMEEGGAEPGSGQLDQSEADYDPGEDPDTDPPASPEQP